MVKFMCPMCYTKLSWYFYSPPKKKKLNNIIKSIHRLTTDGYNLKEFIEKYQFREKIKYDKKTKKWVKIMKKGAKLCTA